MATPTQTTTTALTPAVPLVAIVLLWVLVLYPGACGNSPQWLILLVVLNTSPCTMCLMRSSSYGNSQTCFPCFHPDQLGYSVTTMPPLAFQKTISGTPTPSTLESSTISHANVSLLAKSQSLTLVLKTTLQTSLQSHWPVLTFTAFATTSAYRFLALHEDESGSCSCFRFCSFIFYSCFLILTLLGSLLLALVVVLWLLLLLLSSIHAMIPLLYISLCLPLCQCQGGVQKRGHRSHHWMIDSHDKDDIYIWYLNICL